MEVPIVLSVCILLTLFSSAEKAITPTCENVTLTGNQLMTTCTTTKVNPQAKCQFTLENEGNDIQNITDGTSNITYTPTDPKSKGKKYDSTSCTLHYPVDGLKPGNLTVQVTMYSGQTQGQATNTLQLSVPTVNIRQDVFCPKGLAEKDDDNVRKGYIRQGEKAQCLCSRAHPGNPPGTVGWISQNNGSFSIMSQNENGSTIQINSPDTFTCKSESVLDGSHSANYTPEYAYGPSNASMTLKPSGPIYLCPNQSIHINITCQVPENSFNPDLQFVIREGSNYLANRVAGDTAWSKSGNYSLTRSGQHTFQCRAENVIFRDIFIVHKTNLHVYPHISITGPSVKKDENGTWVMPGSNITVKCLVGQKNDPPVNSMNLTCGLKKPTHGKLSLTKVSSDMTCHCDVEYNTTTICNGDHLTENITIQMAYMISLSDDQHTELPTEPLDLCDPENPNLVVICAVKMSDVQVKLRQGNITLATPDGFSIQEEYFTTKEREYRLVSKLNVTTGGSYTLTCEALNVSDTQNMTIEIRQPPSDRPMMFVQSNQTNDTLVEGDDVTVACNVSGGYPSVQSVTVTCGQDKSVTSNGTLAEMTLNKVDLSKVAKCECQATHVTGCYHLRNVLHLPFNSFSPTQSEIDDSPPIGAVVGGAVGAFVVIAFVVAAIFCIRRGRKQKDAETPNPRGYDNLAHEPMDGYDLAHEPIEGYDPHRDPTAVIRDNAELYGAAAKGHKLQQDPIAESKDNSEVYTTVNKGYDPHQDPTAVFTDNSELYGTGSQEYSLQQDPTAVFRDNSELYATASQEPPLYATPKDNKPKPTMSSSTALPEKYNPETGLNPYDEIEPEELKKKQKLFVAKPKAKPTTGARPKLPSIPKPSVKIKAKPKGSKNDPKDKVTTVAPGGPPFQSANVYEEVQLKDDGNNKSVYSLASNPDLSDNVPAEGPGGPPQPSASNYEEVEIIDQVDKQTGSLSSNPGSSDDETCEGSEEPSQHSTNNYDDVDLSDQVKEESDSVALDCDLLDDETTEGSGEKPQHSTSNYDDVDLGDSVKKQTDSLVSDPDFSGEPPQHSTSNYDEVDFSDSVKKQTDSVASEPDFSGEPAQHSTSNYDEVDLSETAKKQTG